jgi:hypothetical protein
MCVGLYFGRLEIRVRSIRKSTTLCFNLVVVVEPGVIVRDIDDLGRIRKLASNGRK